MADRIWLLRHGDTEWTEHERHTGRRDIPLSENGHRQAQRAGRLLVGTPFASVLVSPQLRARQTAKDAHVPFARSDLCEELAEWDYGEYEGLIDDQTERLRPGWDLFRDGAPGGESPERVRCRLDVVLERVSELAAPCLLVGHGKSLRALVAHFIGAPIALAAHLPMDPAAVCILEREPAGPLVKLWNYTGVPAP
jgi:probable phosphoglycerate mutase